MDTYYYVQPVPGQKPGVDLFVALAPLILSVVAIIISLWVAVTQRGIQLRQLKKDMFDRRLAVYTSTREFLDYVNSRNGYIDLHGPEYGRFKETMERAEMLFERPEVSIYLREIDEAARSLYASVPIEKAQGAGSTDSAFIGKVQDLRVLLSVTLPQQRNERFNRELKMT